MIISAHVALGIELVQNLLLVGVGLNIHRVDFGIVGVEILFCFQCTCKTLFLILAVILKLIGIPVAFKCCSDLINSFRQVPLCDFNIPLKTAGNCSIGEVRGADIGRSKACIAVEYIGFRVQTGTLGIIADLDKRVGQLAQFLDGFYVGSTHV